jgi:hypothetical protein
VAEELGAFYAERQAERHEARHQHRSAGTNRTRFSAVSRIRTGAETKGTHPTLAQWVWSVRSPHGQATLTVNTPITRAEIRAARREISIGSGYSSRSQSLLRSARASSAPWKFG